MGQGLPGKQNFPNINTPLGQVNPDGSVTISQPWMYLLQGLANQSVPSTQVEVAAAGSNQQSATLIANVWNVITTGSGGVRLPVIAPGPIVGTWNFSNTSISIYPYVGGQIDVMGINAAYVLAPTKCQIWYYTSNNHINSLQLG